MNTEEDPFVTYRRKSRYTGEFEDIQLADTNSDMEQTGIHADKGNRKYRDLGYYHHERSFEHIIELEEGTQAVITTPYRHPKRYKDEIEKTIKELLELGYIRPVLAPLHLQ